MKLRKDKSSIERELESEICGLSVMESGSEEKRREVENVATLYRLKLEEQAHKRENVHKVVDNVIGVVGVAATTGIGILGVRWRAEFEKDGVVTGRIYDELGKVLNLILKKKH